MVSNLIPSSRPEKSPVYRTVLRVYCGYNTGKEQDTMDYSIVWVRGHVEVYDWAGRFCFSADSEREAREELDLAA